MKGSGKLEDHLYSMLEPKVTAATLELVEVEYQKEQGGWVLRLVIDRPGGITLDDCSAVSQLAGDVLDDQDPIPHAYRLEVTSPGIDRPLKTRKDFIRFMGEWIEIHLYAAMDGKKVWIGQLSRADELQVCLRLENNKEICVEKEKIAKVNLHVRF